MTGGDGWRRRKQLGRRGGMIRRCFPLLYADDLCRDQRRTRGKEDREDRRGGREGEGADKEEKDEEKRRKRMRKRSKSMMRDEVGRIRRNG